MNSIYSLSKGCVGVLISMPHNGQIIPDDIACDMTQIARNIPDTDWYMDKLYDFAQALGVSVISPVYSRYVIDLNRSKLDKNLYPGANSTELCPTTAFDLSPLYLEDKCFEKKSPTKIEIQQRIEQYWVPYHDAINRTLTELRQEFSQVVLLDAHSILSHVPRFFSGKLPDFNFGTADGKSADQKLLDNITQLNLAPYTSINNGRFKGGYITRHYGEPEKGIHAIQLELSQSTYLDESTLLFHDEKAKEVKKKLKAFVQCLIQFTQQGEC